jgi:dihydrodipicolinate synthase/N-acetylneuraminate lyase
VIALQMLLNDAKDTLKRVKEKISHVDGVRIDMIQSGTQAQNTAEEKYGLVKKLVAQAAHNEEQAAAATAQNNTEKANDNARAAKETRTKAFLLGKKAKRKNTMQEAMLNMPTSLRK